MILTVRRNIGSGNDLLSDGTKPLHEPTYTNHQGGPDALTCGQFNMKCSLYLSLIWAKKLMIRDYSCISQVPMS